MHLVHILWNLQQGMSPWWPLLGLQYYTGTPSPLIYWVSLQPVWRSRTQWWTLHQGPRCRVHSWVLDIHKNQYDFLVTHCHITMNAEGWLHLVTSVMATRMTSHFEESENIIGANHFYTPVFRRDVLWYGAVRPSVRPFVRPSDC